MTSQGEEAGGFYDTPSPSGAPDEPLPVSPQSLLKDNTFAQPTLRSIPVFTGYVNHNLNCVRADGVK